MLRSFFLVLLALFAASNEARPTKVITSPDAAHYELSSYVQENGAKGWLIKSLNTTNALASGAVLQLSQSSPANINNRNGAWTIGITGNTYEKDSALARQVLIASTSQSQAASPPKPTTPIESSAAAKASAIDKGEGIMQVSGSIGKTIGEKIGPAVGAVIGVFIGTEIGSVVGGPIGNFIGRLLGMNINTAFGPSAAN